MVWGSPGSILGNHRTIKTRGGHAAQEDGMKTLSGWFGTIGLTGALGLAGVLAVGGGTAALHQSSLLNRSHAAPLVIQPVSSNGTASAGKSSGAVVDDRGTDINEPADDRGVDANQPADDRGVDADDVADDHGVDATPEPEANRGPGSDRLVQPTAASTPGADDRSGGRSDDGRGGSGSDDGK
jgi:hypothetical protein